jgi:hypothetical protein
VHRITKIIHLVSQKSIETPTHDQQHANHGQADQGLLPDVVALPCRQVGWLGLHPFPFDVSKKKQEAFESHSKRERKQRRRRSSTAVGKRINVLILALKREIAWCFYRRHGHGAFQDMCFYPFHH